MCSVAQYWRAAIVAHLLMCSRPGGPVGAMTRCGLNCGEDAMGSGVPIMLLGVHMALMCPERPGCLCSEEGRRMS